MSSKSILELSSLEARAYFKKESSYVNFELPPYFHFDQLITFSSTLLYKNTLESLCKKGSWPSLYDNVNYTILTNKDGAYSWRPMQIIHPLLYVDLVNTITSKKNWEILTKRFEEFSSSYVKCISIPRASLDHESDKASQITNWWENIEQESLRLGLYFNYQLATDITDCYGSIYTHSIEWAIDDGGKAGAKSRLAKGGSKKSLGSLIDMKLRNLNYGQTNGIPQGSVLMDFIAEIVLGYVDIELTNKIKNETNLKLKDFSILRYRDDYRILTNNPNVGHEILKHLNIILQNVGLKMNSSKTVESDDVVISSIKKEKLDVIFTAPANQGFQREALRIYQLSKKYPNSGLVSKEIGLYYDKIEKRKRLKNIDYTVLISIFTMISVKSPRTIHLTAAINSKLLERIKKLDRRKALTMKIIEKFSDIPNAGLIDVWLQRISAPMGLEVAFQDKFTKAALGEVRNSELWNSDWLKKESIKTIDFASISDLPQKIEDKTITPVIEREEFELYKIVY